MLYTSHGAGHHAMPPVIGCCTIQPHVCRPGHFSLGLFGVVVTKLGRVVSHIWHMLWTSAILLHQWQAYQLTPLFQHCFAHWRGVCPNNILHARLLLACRCLLIEPFPESALNEEAGKLLLENYEEYAKHARLMTSIHAQPPKR